MAVREGLPSGLCQVGAAVAEMALGHTDELQREPVLAVEATWQYRPMRRTHVLYVEILVARFR